MAMSGEREPERSLEDAEAFISEGIFLSIKGSVHRMVMTTEGLAKTQESLLASSRRLLDELKLYDTTRQANLIIARIEKIRQMCGSLSESRVRLEALRRRAEGLEAELEADGCVAGNPGELRL